MIKVDELFGFSNIAGNVEFADGFLFRGFEGLGGGHETFAFSGIFAPLAFTNKKFK